MPENCHPSCSEIQELLALGFTNVLSSFFPVFPGSTGIGRSFIASELNAKSQVNYSISCEKHLYFLFQLTTVFSGGFLLCIMLFLGPLLSPLPMVGHFLSN
jgi:MFS superfamily sulfate permease-like transporter